MYKLDVHFQPVMPPGSSYGFKVFTFGYRSALEVYGPQALVNRWVKTFMTPKGSDLLHPQFGTEFGNLPGSNILRDFTMLQDIVVMSIDDANTQVHDQEKGIYYLNDDELLDSAEFGWIMPSSGGDGFHVGIVINNMAGTPLPLKLTLGATR